MIEIRRILCPVDFSDTSRHAIEHAVAIAKWYESRIVALHVLQAPRLFEQPPILFAEFDSGGSSLPPEIESRERDLRAWLEPAYQAGLKTDLLIDKGMVAAAILDRASSEQVDLIVLGTHGLSGFERFMLGSVAEKVLRKASCPVLTVPPASATSARVPYKRLLCPVDFSESSLAALRFAFSLAEEADGRLSILHVLEWPSDDELFVDRLDGPQYRQMVEEQARTRLDALVPDDVRTWSEPTTQIADGKPYRRILETARTEESDLIVIGVRGRNPLDLTLFGSTTNHVVRRAPCPVLTLKQ
jgi:nucleotide-binding universal stress UspA family protein